VVGTGEGSSKKRAEQDAAHRAIELLYPDKI
jgi:dsRNA-specific ribonuclease